jgi:RHS repeat-associated protein
MHPRDSLGRIVTKTTARGAISTTITYGYDEQGRLETVQTDGQSLKTYKYDANGNRLCSFEGPDTSCAEEAVYDAQDRLMSFEGTEYSYTDRGTLFQKDDGSTLTTYAYDAQGNLTQVSSSAGLSVAYSIDALGRRVGKATMGSMTKQYVWSSQLRIAAELDGSGKVVSRFVYGGSIKVPALIVKPDPLNGDKFYRVITDHLGSPTYIVNVANDSDVMLDASYDEWGNVTQYSSSTGSWPVPFGFAGGLYDEDTGLVRFGARDYDPKTGRWTAKDPIRFAAVGTNLYAYVTGDPINNADPTGLDVEDALRDIATTIATAAGAVADAIAAAARAAGAGVGVGAGIVGGLLCASDSDNTGDATCRKQANEKKTDCLRSGMSEAECEKRRKSFYDWCMDRINRPPGPPRPDRMPEPN